MEKTNSLKIIFAGTPDFAAIALERLLTSNHNVVAVYSQPDRKSGRGLKVKPTPVKAIAEQYKLPVYQPLTLKDQAVQDELASFNADVIVVAAYGALLPAAILHLTPYGCINIHPSLLPRWRGAAPIQRTVQAGDSVTGVTIMQMDTGLDTGPILLQKRYVLDPLETSQSLHDSLAKVGAELLIETLDLLAQEKLKPTPQDSETATYAHKISKEEALIDWNQSALDLEHTIRAFNPWPVAYTTWRGKDMRIWMAHAIANETLSEPRTILNISKQGVDIATGKGVLRLQSVQFPGGKVLSALDFYNAKHQDLIVGEHFI